MQYNVENLFDPDNPPAGYDEFTPDGKAHWTMAKLKAKLINLGKVVTSVKNPDGSVCPDILALSEAHNARALSLWKNGPLKACGYITTVIDPNDPDPRGIRTAVMSKLPLAAKPFAHTTYAKGRLILEVPLKVGETPVVVFTNHWKSRLQFKPGDGNGEEKRKLAAEILNARIKQLQAQNPELDILALGDMNDEPENISLKTSLGIVKSPAELPEVETSKLMWESSFDLLNSPTLRDIDPESLGKAFRMLRGTFYYTNERSYLQFDHILLSRGLFDDQGVTYIPGSFEVVRHPEFTDTMRKAPIPFKVIEDSTGETKAIGASDHFPVLLRMHVNDN